MAPFFFTTDRYIQGIVHANYTSGAPIKGNLTLKATLRPMEDQHNQYNPAIYKDPQRNRDRDDGDRGYAGGNMYRPQIVEKYFNFVSFYAIFSVVFTCNIFGVFVIFVVVFLMLEAF